MRTTIIAALLLASPTALLAQTVDPAVPAPSAAPATIFDGDNITIGLGAAYLPSYEGSDNYLVTVAPLVRGSLGGLDFETRGTGIAVDILPNANDSNVNLLLGPAARVNLDRTRRIKDPVVRALGERDAAIEVGGFAGIALSGVTNPYDTLTARVDVLTDVSGEHDGTTITPSLAFSTPLSRALFVFTSVEATHASDNYAAAYFDVTPAGTVASGLPTFAADGGWKNIAFTLGANYDLDGDLANGGLGLFLGGSYSRLLEDAARSPIVSIRGDRDQWFAAAGLTYSF